MSNKGKHLAILFLMSSILWAQQVKFDASAEKTEVSVNERFSIKFVVSYGQNNIKVDQPLKLPSFGGLHQLAESSQENFQIINGNVMNRSGAEVVLVAEQEGEYKIGSATITINGKRYKTDPIIITVKKGLKQKTQPGQRLKGAFLSTEVSDENPFVNQEVILVVKLYARDYSILNRIKNYDEPDFANLVAKFVSEKPDDYIKQELIGGQTFVSQELARYIIYPQKAGNIEIDPFGLSVIISGYYGSEVVPISSDPTMLHVKSLPAPKPKNFTGAVGNYKMNVSLSKKEIEANQAVNLEVELIGSGNLNSLKTPAVPHSEFIETYPPKRKDAFEPRPSGMKGKITEEHILVPQYGGEYKIGPVSFTYFDPSKAKYVQLQAGPLPLQVDGPKPPNKVANNPSDSTQQEAITDHQRKDSSLIQKLDLPEKISDVKKTVAKTVNKNNSWIWVIGGILILTLCLFWFRKNKKRQVSSMPTMKQQTAKFKSEIQQKLNELNKVSKRGDESNFVTLQEEILTQIGMHFSHTSLADFTENHVEQKLADRFNQNLASQWKSQLLDCKQTKYARGLAEVSLSEKYQSTNSLVNAFFSYK